MHYSHLVFYFEIIFIAFFSGFGYALLIFTKNLTYAIVSAPIVSYLIISLLSANLNFIGLSTGQFSKQLIIFNFIINLLIIIGRHPNFRSIKTRTILIVLVFSLYNSMVILSSSLLHNSFNYFNDHTTYVIISEFLQKNSFNKLASVKSEPWTDNVNLYQTYELRMGASFFTATFKNFLNVGHTIEIYPAITAFAELLMFLSYSLLCLSISKSKIFLFISLFLLTISTSLNHKILLLGFLPQTYGLSILVLLIFTIFRVSKLKYLTWEYFTLNAIATAALFSTYQEIAPFSFILILILIIYFKSKNVLNYKTLVRTLSSYLAAFFLTPKTFLMFINGIIIQSKGVVGWFQETTPLQYLLQFIGIGPVANPNKYFILTTVFLVSIVIFSSIKVIHKAKFTPILILNLFFLSIVVIFQIATIDPFKGINGNTWSIFKLHQWFYWTPLLLISFFFTNFWNKKVIINKILIISIFSLLAYVYRDNFKYLRYTFSTEQVINAISSKKTPLEEYQEIRNLSLKNTVNPANIFFNEQHPNVVQLPLSILQDNSIGVFLSPNDSQVFVRNQTNFIPNPNFFNWIYSQNAQVCQSPPIFQLAGFNIYPAHVPLIHFAAGFSKQGTNIQLEENIANGEFRVFNNSTKDIKIKAKIKSNCTNIVKFKINNQKVNTLYLKQDTFAEIDLGSFVPGFYQIRTSNLTGSDCLPANSKTLLSDFQIL